MATVNFSLHPDRDKDILEAIGKADNKSAYIRDALRFYSQQPTSADLLEAIRDVETELRRLRVSGVKMDAADGVGEESSDSSNKEPEEAARNLDGLLERLESFAPTLRGGSGPS